MQKTDLVNCFDLLGIEKGDTLFCHSNMSMFFLNPQEPEELCQVVLETVLDYLGPSGTFVIPTFTYSHSSGQPFDKLNTPSNCGYFAEYVRNNYSNNRSSDPNVSVCAIGALESDIKSLDNHPYKKSGLFSLLEQNKAKVLNFNLDAGSTYIHYVERLFNVDYRYDKRFTGMSIIDGIEEEVESSLYVRSLDLDMSDADFSHFHKLAKASGFYKMEKIGRGLIGTISFEETKQIIKKELLLNPYFLTKRG